MSTDELSIVFAALADPTRRAILERLAQGPATVNELAAPFDMSGPAISKHLRVLDNAGLTSTARVAQSRPRTLAADRLGEATDWTEKLRSTWEARHDALATYLIQLQEKESPHD